MKSAYRASAGPTFVHSKSKDDIFPIPASGADAGNLAASDSTVGEIEAPAVSQTSPRAPALGVPKAKAVPPACPAAATSHVQHQQSDEGLSGHASKGRIEAEQTSPVYETLSEGFIRLVRIEQDPSTKGIKCRTKLFSLAELPPYTALSYACGSRPANFNMKLNGQDWFVRKKLFHFLRQRLQMDRDPQEWLWIDAICINQEDLPERTHQVLLMADIYGKASRVVAWLGPAYEQSDDAMRGLARSQGRESSLETVPWILALAGLCSRRYWHRLWVLQELKLAKDRDLMCGSKAISWQRFETFMLLVRRTNESTLPTLSRRIRYIRNGAAMRMIKLTSAPAGTSLWNLLDKSEHLQCEETRDRVYALCGLATREAASIDPDYEIRMPVLLNKILRFHLEQVPKISITTVASACGKLESMFGTQPGAIFELHGSTNHLTGQPGLLYQRLCTRSIDMPGLTLLWAIHYDHLRVQELIKMAHRFQSPSYFMLYGLQGVGFIVGLCFLSRLISGSDSDFRLDLKGLIEVGSVIVVMVLMVASINVAALQSSYSYRSERRLSKLTIQASCNSEWEKESAWSFYTALKHRPTWRTLWWVPFIIHEGLVYITAPARQPLKRWFPGP